MAKTDSFFVRAIVDADNTGTFTQTEIDLGAFVDALGSTILTVKSIAVQYTDNSNITEVLFPTASNSNAMSAWQLTTQSQTAMQTLDDKALIASGRLVLSKGAGAGNVVSYVDVVDVGPQAWSNGYNVATESIFLSGQTSTGMSDGVNIAIILECVSRKMTQAAAMALALSQQ